MPRCIGAFLFCIEAFLFCIEAFLYYIVAISLCINEILMGIV